MFRPLLPLLLASSLFAASPAFLKTGAGPGVLLIHGFGGNRQAWSGVAASLAREHTVIQVDLPGSGGTAGPEMVEGAADFEAVAKDLALLARREFPGPCLLVGHSMGGPLAALTVLRDPSAFRGLVLVDSFLGGVPAGMFDATLKGLDADPAASLSAFYGPMAAGPAQTQRLVKEALQVPVPVLKAYLLGMVRNPLKGRHAELKLPVVQFQAGPEAPEAGKRAALRAMFGFSNLPDFRVVPFAKAKHWVMWDEPEAFLAALAAFEQGLKAR